MQIKKGDFVLSHDGTFNEVIDFFNQGIKLTYVIEGYGFENIHATGNHKFYVRKRNYTYTHATRIKTFSEPDWIAVDDLLNENPKDIYFGNRINEKSIVPSWDGIDLHTNKTDIKHVNTLNMEDKRLWYIVGRYLGDGWLRKQQKPGEKRTNYSGVVICDDYEKVDSLIKRIGDIFPYTESFETTTVKLIFSNTELAMFLEQFGVGAENKKIPGFVYDMPVDLLKELVEGYLDSDGCRIENRFQFTTISRELAYGIAQILEKVYQKPCQIYLTKTNNKKEIEDRVVHQKNFYLIRCILESKRESAFYESGYIWYPLHKIKEYKEECVYDIEVKNTHSFVANGAITHNCQDYSVAHTLSKSKGIEGKKGVLFWDIAAILEAKHSAFGLFENVDRLLKSPAKQRGRDFGIMLRTFNDLGYNVEWRVINAADYGAPQRRRRTFIFVWRKETKYNKQASGSSKYLLSSGIFAKTFPVENVEELKITEIDLRPYEDTVEMTKSFKAAFENTGVMIDGIVYTCTTTPILETPTTIGEIRETRTGLDKYILENDKLEKFEYLRGSKKIPRKRPDGSEYFYSEGAMSPFDNLDLPGRTMLTSEGSINRSTHIIPDAETGKLRLLTPVEAERLQCFPDNWTDTGMPENRRYFMMGNALVTKVINRLEPTLRKIIEKE